jgi:hypothetical protein
MLHEYARLDPAVINRFHQGKFYQSQRVGDVVSRKCGDRSVPPSAARAMLLMQLFQPRG